MVIRTYIDKNNTIIKDSETNTGRNPIAELFYGGAEAYADYTRHLVYFDVADLQARYANGEFGNLSTITHKLRMCNSSYFDTDLQGQILLDGKQRTSSFDLVLFRISGQTWDEGTGYDYQRVLAVESDNNITFIRGASNWFNRTTLEEWTQDGVYSGSTPTGITITTQHFDKGNENIEMDMTTEINSLISGGTDNYGYGIAFVHNLENLIVSPAQYVGFFTRHTQTYYEPFVETINTEYIKDDRKNFYKNKTNKLYLYSNVGSEPTNLDNNPSVTIYDDNGIVFSAITTAQTIQVSTGIYYAEVFVPESVDDGVLYFDVWSDLNVNGVSLSDVELDFEVKDSIEYYQIGNNESLPTQYAMSLSGVKRDEKIKRGDKRKIFVSARLPFTINESKVIDNLEYRLWVREGSTQVSVIEWQPVNRAYLKNYFILDTSWMIPNRYFIDIKLTSNQEVKHYVDQMQFEIVNQVNALH